MSASLFIDRPVLASVISIVITLAGWMALGQTPVAQFPEVTPPTVTVAAAYPGATAEVIANTVAAPIEQQVNGVDDMIYMYSTSSATGSMTLTVSFEPGANPDISQVNVQNRVNQALSKLPQVVSQQGVTVEKKSQAFMMIIGIYSPEERYSPLYIANYTNLYVLDALKRIPGANMSAVLGGADIAMRIWLKPDRLAQLGITAQEVADAIRSQNQAFGIGQIGQTPAPAGTLQSFSVTAQGMLVQPEEFDDIILRTDPSGTAIVRLRDVGYAELGAKDYSMQSKLNGKPATLLAVYQQPGANALETSRLVREQLEILKKGFPAGLDYKVVTDTSKFTEASIEKVVHTFFEAVVLVVLVVYLFLQSLRATVIPILAVPIAIVGAYSGLYLLGFSTNMLTLFGMILSIGLVVDDAIIVVESVEHSMATLGLTPREAAKKAMGELTGALIAIVLVLVSVFLPVAFLGGMTGTLYKQFAITISISMVLSGVVALTLTPALAALILKPGHHEKRGFFKWFEAAFGRLTDGYVAGVAWVLHHRIVALGLFLATLGVTVILFRVVPGSFVPQEDQGYVFGINQLPDAASLERTSAMADRSTEIIAAHPAVQDVGQFAGFSLIDEQGKTNAAVLFVSLKPFEERDTPELSAFSVLPALNRQLASVKEGISLMLNPPSIPGLGTTGGFEFYIQNRGTGDAAALERVTRDFLAKTKQRPELADVSTPFTASSQQLYLDLDRAKAEILGVPIATAFQTLQSFFGSAYVSQFTQFSRIWQVIIQAPPLYRDDPADLEGIYMRSTEGKMVPLSALATVRYISGPSLLPRFNGFPAAKITGSPAPGYSSGQALDAMEAVAAEGLPGDYSYAWAGQAYEEKKAGGTTAVVFVFGLIMVFLILAAQYEKWTLPIGVVLSVPFAIFGALAFTWARGLENDVYLQVGLVTLIGLSAKNAILIVEFAIEGLHEGKTAVEAALEAARLRLRPIVMTSLALILGTVPLAIATGPGANSLHAIGTGIIGGMLASTAIAIFFVPLFFVLLEDLTGLFGRRAESGASAGGAAVPAIPRSDAH